MRLYRAMGLCAVLCFACSALADEVVFKNGDRLTGKIVKADGGKLTIASKVAGEVTVDLADVTTFSSDGPVEVLLNDGTKINQRIAAADEGKFGVAAGGAIAPQAFPIASVKKVNPPPVAWTGSLTAGALITRGNSKSDNFNLSFDAVRRTDMDRITLGATYLYGRQKDQSTGDESTTVDNWSVDGKYDYFFTPKFFGYANVQVQKDRIADLDLRFIPGAGLGYQWVETPKLNFFTEGGLSWVYEQYSHPDDTREHAALRLAYHVDWQCNDKVKLFHDLEYLPSLSSWSEYLVNADAGVRADITGSFFSEFKVVADYNSKPADDHDKTDLRYLLGVGWKF